MILLLLLTLAGGLVFVTILGGRQLDATHWRQHLMAYRLTLPAGLSVEADRWLGLVVAHTQAPRWSLLPAPPVALEVVGTRSGIAHVLLVPARDHEAVLAGLRAAMPGVRLTEDPAYFKDRPRCRTAAELTMNSVRRPLLTTRADSASAALLAGLQPLRDGEVIVLQAICTGAGGVRPIPSANQRRDRRLLGDSDLSDSEAIRAARAKQANPMLAVSLRLGAAADTTADARRLLHRSFGAVRSLNAEGVRVLRRWWLPNAVVSSRLRRLAVPIARYPLLLSTPEAAGLFGLITTTPLPGLTLGAARQLPPPARLPSTGSVLADSNCPGTSQPVRLTMADRTQHMMIMGPTGVGKSTLVANLALQDIEAGYGVIVIDPKADLCTDILARMPAQRAQDVIVLDPSRVDRPVAFNILAATHDEQHRELVVDHVIHIWHELYEAYWGPRSEDLLRGALLTLINTRAADGSAFTLVEVPEILGDAAFRRFVLTQPTVPPGLKSFWGWYQGLKITEQQRVAGPILSKLRAATLRTPIRLTLGQSHGLDIEAVLRDRKILLAPLGKGTVGPEVAGLAGTILLATLWHGLLARTRLPAAQRWPVGIFIDEAQDVLRLPVDLSDMLAQARSLGGAFTLAHQHLGQITNKQIKSALIGTVRSSVLFQCGFDDAATMAKAYAPYLTADDLRGLAAYEVALRLCLDGQTVAPTTGRTRPLSEPTTDAEALARASRERYGVPRQAVEEAIQRRLSVPAGSPRTGSARSSPTTASDTNSSTGPALGRRPRPTNPPAGDGS